MKHCVDGTCYGNIWFKTKSPKALIDALLNAEGSRVESESERWWPEDRNEVAAARAVASIYSERNSRAAEDALCDVYNKLRAIHIEMEDAAEAVAYLLKLRRERMVKGSMPRPGSVIHGTLRSFDLVYAFIDKLDFLGQDISEYEYLDKIPEDDPFWDSEDASMLVEELMDKLNELAPEGYYFGAHQGDGSDFGFWPVMDMD